MNKSELLDKIREKNNEIHSLNRQLKEILKKENFLNVGKCFKYKDNSELYYIYYKIIQTTEELGRYKVLCVTHAGISIYYWSIIDNHGIEPCSSEEFDEAYNKVISSTLANKIIYE